MPKLFVQEYWEYKRVQLQIRWVRTSACVQRPTLGTTTTIQSGNTGTTWCRHCLRSVKRDAFERWALCDSAQNCSPGAEFVNSVKPPFWFLRHTGISNARKKKVTRLGRNDNGQYLNLGSWGNVKWNICADCKGRRLCQQMEHWKNKIFFSFFWVVGSRPREKNGYSGQGNP